MSAAPVEEPVSDVQHPFQCLEMNPLALVIKTGRQLLLHVEGIAAWLVDAGWQLIPGCAQQTQCTDAGEDLVTAQKVRGLAGACDVRKMTEKEADTLQPDSPRRPQTVTHHSFIAHHEV